LTDPVNGTLDTFNSDGSFSYTPSLDFHGSDSFTYKANDGSADSVPATVIIRTCFLCDDFEDGDLTSPAWTLKSGTWSVVSSGGTHQLQGVTNSNGKASIISPTFTGSTTAVRTMEVNNATIKTAGGRITLTVYQKDKTHYVKLTMGQDNQKLVLKQKSGRKSRSLSIATPVVTNTPYDLKVDFDGTNFHVFKDGVLVGTMVKKAVPSGIGGVSISSTTSAVVTATIEDFDIE